MRSGDHWTYLTRVLDPILTLYAALPIITSPSFGIFAPKPNAATCLAHGGKGSDGY